MSPPTKQITIFSSTSNQASAILHYLLITRPQNPANAPPPFNYTFQCITTQSPSQTTTTSLPTTYPITTRHLPIESYFSVPHLTEILNATDILYLHSNSCSPSFMGKRGPTDPTSESSWQELVLGLCVECGVDLVVLSTLPGLGEVGEWVTDFREKGRAKEIAKGLAEREGLRVVFVELGWYYSNWVIQHPLGVEEEEEEVEGGDGEKRTRKVVTVGMPAADEDAKGPWVSTYTDLGPIFYGLITNPSPYLSKTIFLCSEYLSLRDIASTYTRVTSQPTKIIHTTPIAWYHDFHTVEGTLEEREWAYVSGVFNGGYYGAGDDEQEGEILARGIMWKVEGRDLMTFEEWLRKFKVDALEEGFGEVVRNSKGVFGGKVYI